MKTTMKSIVLLITCILLMPMAVFAAPTSLSFNPSNTFSGDTPIGSLTASFTDVTGGVELVINSNLASGENLNPDKALHFNFNPSKVPTNLSFALSSNTNFSQQATVLRGADSFKADGVGGLYDIRFTYLYSTKAFTSGQSQTYKITTSSGNIFATDFTNYLSSSTPGNGTTWLAAAHVQGTTDQEGSGWVGATTTPLPAAAWLLGSGLLGLIGIRKRSNS